MCIRDRGCGLDRSDGADWKVTTRSWRADLSREVDLIEEIARVKVMDTIPETLPAVSRPLDRFGQETVPGFRQARSRTRNGSGCNSWSSCCGSGSSAKTRRCMRSPGPSAGAGPVSYTHLHLLCLFQQVYAKLI